MNIFTNYIDIVQHILYNVYRKIKKGGDGYAYSKTNY